MMIAKEERPIESIAHSQKGLTGLCSQLRVEPFQEEGTTAVSQLDMDVQA